jgi:hypothetical protein
MYPTSPAPRRVRRLHRRREEADLLRLETRALAIAKDVLASAELPSTTRTKATTPRVLVVRRVEDERAGEALAGSPSGRRIRSSDRVQHGSTYPSLRLGRDPEHVIGWSPTRPGELARGAFRRPPAAGRSCSRPAAALRSFSIASMRSRTVCASIPWAASTTSTAPSHACSARETSYVKSTCPGVSIRFSSCPSTSRAPPAP